MLEGKNEVLEGKIWVLKGPVDKCFGICDKCFMCSMRYEIRTYPDPE